MNILKDRAIWIVVVVMILAGGIYMIVIDPDRVEKMDDIVVRDDTRKADNTETNERIRIVELELLGDKKNLQKLRDEYDIHIKAYDSKVDSINKAFSKVDIEIDKILRDMKDKFAEVQDQLEDLEDDISSLKTQTKRDFRAVNAEISALKEAIDEINTKLDE